MLIPLLGSFAGEPDYYALEPGENYLGRVPSCAIFTKNESVSRVHAKFYKEGPNWWVADQGSRNGIAVNGRPVDKLQLFDGDIIKAGEYYAVFSKREASQYSSLKEWIRVSKQKARVQAGLVDEKAEPEVGPAGQATMTSRVEDKVKKFDPLAYQKTMPTPVPPKDSKRWKILVGIGLVVLIALVLYFVL